VILDPLLTEIKEDFALVGVEVIGNVNRATDVVAELIVVDRSGDAGGEGNSVARPGVGVERGIAEIFVNRAVKLAAAGFRGDANLRAGAAAILGSVVGGENLDFLCGVHIGSADAGAVGARKGAGSTIEGD